MNVIQPTRFFCFPEDYAGAMHRFRDSESGPAHEFGLVLTNAMPDRVNWKTIADVPEISEVAGKPVDDNLPKEQSLDVTCIYQGYPKGGAKLIPVYLRSRPGSVAFAHRPVVFKAWEKPIGPYRAAVVYNRTNGKLIAFIAWPNAEEVIPKDHVSIEFSENGIFNAD